MSGEVEGGREGVGSVGEVWGCGGCLKIWGEVWE